VTQKYLIPTISLVFYYGFTKWSLKLRKARVQNISERVFRTPKVLSKVGGSNRRRIKHIQEGQKTDQTPAAYLISPRASSLRPSFTSNWTESLNG
jgi:hypothetical protein